MAIAEDASSPAQVSTTSGKTVTTASFTPPAGSLVVAIGQVGAATSSTTTCAISSSPSSSWTTAVGSNGNNSSGTDFGGSVTIAYHYYATSPGSITVTATGSGSLSDVMLNVKVLTGVSSSAPLGATASTVKTSSSTAFTTSITTTAAGSVLYGGASNSDNNNTLTANNSTLIGSNVSDSSVQCVMQAFESTSATGTPGPTTIGVNGSTSNTGGPVAVAEFLASGSGGGGGGTSGISFIAESHSPGYGSSYAGSVSCNKPTGTAEFDLMVWVVGGTASSTPSGWTRQGSAVDSGSVSMGSVQVFTKIAGASEPSSYTCNFDSTYFSAACSISTYRGVSTTTPIGNSAISAVSGTTNFNTGSVTASSGQWAYSFACDYTFNGSSHTFTEGSGTERTDFGTSNSDPATAEFMSCDSAANVSAGSFSRTQTCSTTVSDGVRGILLINAGTATVVNASAGLVSATASAKQPTIAPHPDCVFAAASAKDPVATPGKAPAGGLVSCFGSAKQPKALAGFLVFPGAALVTANVRAPAYSAPAGAVAASVFVGSVIAYQGTPTWRTNKVPADARTIVIARDKRTYVVPADKPEQQRIV